VKVARRNSPKKKNENIFKNILEKYILTSQTFPLVLVFSTLGILFVLIRMKGIEQDYQINEIAKQIKIESIENKELKADRARVLSVKNLRGFAKKYNLKEPNEKHIIIIP